MFGPQITRKILALFRVQVGLQGAAPFTSGQNGLPVPANVDAFGVLWTRDASAAQVTQTSNFDLFSIPAAATQATATQASAGAGKRNVLTSLTFHTNAVAAQAQQTVEVLDGAVVIWSVFFGAFALGTSGDHTVTFPNGLVGSFATAMTIRFAAAPAATNFNSIAGAGYIAG